VWSQRAKRPYSGALDVKSILKQRLAPYFDKFNLVHASDLSYVHQMILFAIIDNALASVITQRDTIVKERLEYLKTVTKKAEHLKSATTDVIEEFSKKNLLNDYLSMSNRTKRLYLRIHYYYFQANGGVEAAVDKLSKKHKLDKATLMEMFKQLLTLPKAGFVFF
jgi:hypothetical protein